jgi:hypothetical protein
VVCILRSYLGVITRTNGLKVWLVCETVIIFFLYPETKGPTLEDITHSKRSTSSGIITL